MNESKAVTKNKKLNVGSTIAYAIGSSGSNASFYMINNYLMLFYTDIVGLAGTAISLIMLIARIWDAINDPMMGMIEDRTKSKLGKFRPWLIIGPPFLALFNILTFTVFPLTGALKAVVCGICYIGAGMAYTIIQVAINGLVNRITDDSNDKVKVISIAQIANQIGQIGVAAVLMPIILHFSGSDVANARGYFWGTFILCIVTVPMIWIAAWKCREVSVEQIAVDIDANAPQEKKKISDSLKLLAKNDQLLIAALTTFISCVGIIGRFGLLSYYIIYVVGSYKLIAPVFSLMSFAQMVGNVPLPYLSKKFGKKNIYIWANICSAITMVILFFLGQPSTAVVIALSALIGFFGASGSISYSFICDCVEYGDWKYGIRDDGLAFSVMTFGVKLAQAIGGAVGAPLIFAVGYVANEAQSAGTITAMSAIINVIPAVLLVLAVIPVIFKYKLDDKMMDQITAELVERRAGVSNEV